MSDSLLPTDGDMAKVTQAASQDPVLAKALLSVYKDPALADAIVAAFTDPVLTKALLAAFADASLANTLLAASHDPAVAQVMHGSVVDSHLRDVLLTVCLAWQKRPDKRKESESAKKDRKRDKKKRWKAEKKERVQLDLVQTVADLARGANKQTCTVEALAFTSELVYVLLVPLKSLVGSETSLDQFKRLFRSDLDKHQIQTTPFGVWPSVLLGPQGSHRTDIAVALNLAQFQKLLTKATGKEISPHKQIDSKKKKKNDKALQKKRLQAAVDEYLTKFNPVGKSQQMIF
jgi:hypothetical protein